MSASRARLGRGLSALLGEVDDAVATTAPPATERNARPRAGAASAEKTAAAPGARPARDGVRFVPIAELQRNPDQPRKRFDERELDELSSSIKA
ncbi:MAG: hypothetical protein MI723_05030, partial [Caulobacterales bacterium]|nr:hypothetical protein [Caulobacterales bacterium]